MLDPLLRRNAVLAIVQVDYSTLWTWCRDGRFPAPIQLNPGSKRPRVAWLSSEVEGWLSTRPRGFGPPVPQPHLAARRAAKAAVAAAEATPRPRIPLRHQTPRVLP
jgi:predicted DNA-binding transcriptional regulator AlpA